MLKCCRELIKSYHERGSKVAVLGINSLSKHTYSYIHCHFVVKIIIQCEII